jgi:rare lipoprotein A (peptidoglycan hydrolase)
VVSKRNDRHTGASLLLVAVIAFGLADKTTGQSEMSTTLPTENPRSIPVATSSDGVPPSSGPILEPTERQVRPVPPRPQPIAQPVAELQPTRQPAKPKPAGTTVTGVASWYCGHGSTCTRGHVGGLYAAIRRDLLYLRGRVVTVRSGGRSVRVKIIDCNCGPHANLIDMYSDAFGHLAPLSAGRIRVTVSW